MSYYNINITKKAKRDIRRISNYIGGYSLQKTYQKIDKDIANLNFMPRIHKTLYSSKDPNGEYRRIVSGKYIIIYQIQEEQINILRIFNQKENYLNQRNFILREKSQLYLIIKKKIRTML